MKRRFHPIKEIPCVERAVSKVIEDFTVKLISSRFCRDIGNRARIAAELGAEGRIIDFEFIDGVDRWLERDLLVRNIVQIDSIDHEVHAVLAGSGGVEAEKSLTAQ